MHYLQASQRCGRQSSTRWLKRETDQDSLVRQALNDRQLEVLRRVNDQTRPLTTADLP